MTREKFMGLFLLDDAEADEILVNNNLKLLKKKYREAVKVYHPDSGKYADKQLFEELKTAFDTIRLSGIDDLVDSASNALLYFDLKELQVTGSEVLIDVNGVRHERKKVVSNGIAGVSIKVKLNVDGYEYLCEIREPYRLDNKYSVELRPLVHREKFFEKKEHTLKLSYMNSVEEKETELKWNGCVRNLCITLAEFKASLNVRLSIQFLSEDD